MPSNSKTAVVQVKEAYSIEDYIASDGVVLKQSGANKLKGLCPMPDHNERTPSFTVDTQFQNYYCFGCKATGDILSYVQATQNLGFYDALKMLAADKGIEIHSASDEPSVDYASLRAIVKAAALFYAAHFKRLNEDHPAKLQITDRGLQTSTLRYGYAPEKRKSLYSFLRGKGFSDDLIHQSGVCRRSDSGGFYDFWNGRLMFVIADIQGNPIGFSGRKLFDSDNRGKYVNSTDTPLFNKSKALFNVSRAKKAAGREKELYVVEGQFDVVAFVESGLENVVASSGTAFTESHAQTCSRLVSGDKGAVIFAFDGDSAGKKAARRVFEECPDLHTIAFALPFSDGDPCDYREEHGSEGLAEFAKENRTPLVDFVLDNLESEFDLKSTTGRARYVKEASQLLAGVKSKSIIDSATRRVALHAVSSYASVASELDEARKNLKKTKPAPRPKPQTTDSSSDDDDEPPLVPPDDEMDDSYDRPDSEESTSADELLELIRTDKSYALAARFIALTLRFKKLRPQLAESEDILPSDLRPFARDMASMLKDSNERTRLLPEAFTLEDVARELMSQKYMEHLSAMSAAEIVSLYKRLRKKLREDMQHQEIRSRQGEIAQILSAKGGGSVDDLRKALAMEEKLKKEVV